MSPMEVADVHALDCSPRPRAPVRPGGTRRALRHPRKVQHAVPTSVLLAGRQDDRSSLRSDHRAHGCGFYVPVSAALGAVASRAFRRALVGPLAPLLAPLFLARRRRRRVAARVVGRRRSRPRRARRVQLGPLPAAMICTCGVARVLVLKAWSARCADYSISITGPGSPAPPVPPCGIQKRRQVAPLGSAGRRSVVRGGVRRRAAAPRFNVRVRVSASLDDPLLRLGGFDLAVLDPRGLHRLRRLASAVRVVDLCEARPAAVVSRFGERSGQPPPSLRPSCAAPSPAALVAAAFADRGIHRWRAGSRKPAGTTRSGSGSTRPSAVRPAPASTIAAASWSAGCEQRRRAGPHFRDRRGGP